MKNELARKQTEYQTNAQKNKRVYFVTKPFLVTFWASKK